MRHVGAADDRRNGPAITPTVSSRGGAAAIPTRKSTTFEATVELSGGEALNAASAPARGARTMPQKRDWFLGRLGAGSLIMGIVNATPDSFSDGGRFQTSAAAVAQAKRLVAEGADIIDVGAESTRPGHQPVSADVEQARLAPLLRDVVESIDQPVSIDTSKASVGAFRRRPRRLHSSTTCGACSAIRRWPTLLRRRRPASS